MKLFLIKNIFKTTLLNYIKKNNCYLIINFKSISALIKYIFSNRQNKKNQLLFFLLLMNFFIFFF